MCQETNIVILLTSCVNPNGMAFTAIQDPVVRLSQYQNSIDWYLRHTNYKIVVTDNSGYDFSVTYAKEVAQGRIEILFFDGNNYDKSIGKGYGEAKIIDYTIAHSSFITTETNIVKITGRLKVLNINKLLWNYYSGVMIWTYILGDRIICDSRFFVAPVAFFVDYFLKEIDSLNDSHGYFFENLLFKKYIQWKRGGGAVSYFYRPIKFSGIGASAGVTYKSSTPFSTKIRALLSGLLNHLNFYYLRKP